MMGDSARRYTLLQGFLPSVSAGPLYPDGFSRIPRSHRILLNTDHRPHDNYYGALSDFPESLIFI